MGHRFSALFVYEEDDFLEWLFNETTPEFWFNQCGDWIGSGRPQELRCVDILTLLRQDSREFYYGCCLCERLERYYGTSYFTINAMELYSALILLAGIGCDYQCGDRYRQQSEKVRGIQRRIGNLLSQNSNLGSSVTSDSSTNQTIESVLRTSPYNLIKLFPGYQICEKETYMLGEVYNLRPFDTGVQNVNAHLQQHLASVNQGGGPVDAATAGGATGGNVNLAEKQAQLQQQNLVQQQQSSTQAQTIGTQTQQLMTQQLSQGVQAQSSNFKGSNLNFSRGGGGHTISQSSYTHRSNRDQVDPRRGPGSKFRLSTISINMDDRYATSAISQTNSNTALAGGPGQSNAAAPSQSSDRDLATVTTAADAAANALMNVAAAGKNISLRARGGGGGGGQGGTGTGADGGLGLGSGKNRQQQQLSGQQFYYVAGGCGVNRYNSNITNRKSDIIVAKKSLSGSGNFNSAADNNYRSTYLNSPDSQQGQTGPGSGGPGNMNTSDVEMSTQQQNQGVGSGSESNLVQTSNQQQNAVQNIIGQLQQSPLGVQNLAAQLQLQQGQQGKNLQTQNNNNMNTTTVRGISNLLKSTQDMMLPLGISCIPSAQELVQSDPYGNSTVHQMDPTGAFMSMNHQSMHQMSYSNQQIQQMEIDGHGPGGQGTGGIESQVDSDTTVENVPVPPSGPLNMSGNKQQNRIIDLLSIYHSVKSELRQRRLELDLDEPNVDLFRARRKKMNENVHTMGIPQQAVPHGAGGAATVAAAGTSPNSIGGNTRMIDDQQQSSLTMKLLSGRSISQPAFGTFRLEGHLKTKLEMLLSMKMGMHQIPIPDSLYSSQISGLFVQTCKGLHALATNMNSPTITEIQYMLWQLGLEENENLKTSQILSLFLNSNQWFTRFFWKKLLILDYRTMEYQALVKYAKVCDILDDLEGVSWYKSAVAYDPSEFKFLISFNNSADRKESVMNRNFGNSLMQGGVGVNSSENLVSIRAGALDNNTVSEGEDSSGGKQSNQNNSSADKMNNNINSSSDAHDFSHLPRNPINPTLTFGPRRQLWMLKPSIVHDLWLKATSLDPKLLFETLNSARRRCKEEGIPTSYGRGGSGNSNTANSTGICYYKSRFTPENLGKSCGYHTDYWQCDVSTSDFMLVYLPALIFELLCVKSRPIGATMLQPVGHTNATSPSHSHGGGHGHHSHHGHSNKHSNKSSAEHQSQSTKSTKLQSSQQVQQQQNQSQNNNQQSEDHSNQNQSQSPTGGADHGVVKVVTTKHERAAKKRTDAGKSQAKIASEHNQQSQAQQPRRPIDTIISPQYINGNYLSHENPIAPNHVSFWFKGGRVIGGQCLHILKRLLVRIGGEELYSDIDFITNCFNESLGPPYLISREYFIKQVGSYCILQDRRRFYNQMKSDFDLLAVNNEYNGPGNFNSQDIRISEDTLRGMFQFTLQDCIHTVCQREKPFHSHIVKILGDQVIKEMRALRLEFEDSEKKAKANANIEAAKKAAQIRQQQAAAQAAEQQQKTGGPGSGRMRKSIGPTGFNIQQIQNQKQQMQGLQQGFVVGGDKKFQNSLSPNNLSNSPDPKNIHSNVRTSSLTPGQGQNSNLNVANRSDQRSSTTGPGQQQGRLSGTNNFLSPGGVSGPNSGATTPTAPGATGTQSPSVSNNQLPSSNIPETFSFPSAVDAVTRLLRRLVMLQPMVHKINNTGGPINSLGLGSGSGSESKDHGNTTNRGQGSGSSGGSQSKGTQLQGHSSTGALIQSPQTNITPLTMLSNNQQHQNLILNQGTNTATSTQNQQQATPSFTSSFKHSHSYVFSLISALFEACKSERLLEKQIETQLQKEAQEKQLQQEMELKGKQRAELEANKRREDEENMERKRQEKLRRQQREQQGLGQGGQSHSGGGPIGANVNLSLNQQGLNVQGAGHNHQSETVGKGSGTLGGSMRK